MRGICHWLTFNPMTSTAHLTAGVSAFGSRKWKVLHDVTCVLVWRHIGDGKTTTNIDDKICLNKTFLQLTPLHCHRTTFIFTDNNTVIKLFGAFIFWGEGHIPIIYFVRGWEATTPTLAPHLLASCLHTFVYSASEHRNTEQEFLQLPLRFYTCLLYTSPSPRD